MLENVETAGGDVKDLKMFIYAANGNNKSEVLDTPKEFKISDENLTVGYWFETIVR
jgi:hypothetical protein